MADFFNSFTLKASRLDTAIWAARLVLLSAGIISTAILFKVAVIPFTFNLLISTLPSFWVSFKGWLSPPYIYIIVNFIIITIAASSNFQGNQKHTSTILAFSSPSNNDSDDIWGNMLQQEEEEEEKEDANSTVVNTSEETIRRDACMTGSNEKHHDDTIEEKAETEQLQQDDTLEATWKAIMEGQGKIPTRHLKKSDTWDKPPTLVSAKPKPEDDFDPVTWAKKEFRKADTFNDSVSLRREKSMSQEELNRRAEAFIKKINYKMRLERLESEQRLIEMVKEGV